MKKPLSILVCTLVMGLGAMSSHAQAKTAKACTEEWRADKAGFQAKGITEKAYVAECRAGTASAPAAAPAPTAAAPAPRPMAPTPAATNAGQKTAKACTAEWRADKAGFQAKGITEKAYVADCRAGTASAPAPAPAPTAAAPAPSPAAPASPAPRPTAAAPTQAPAAPTTRGPPGGSPSAAGQFATEVEAKATCPADTVVWVNLNSKIYHFSGTHNYGTTKNGAYMCEKDTAAQGMRAAKNEQHP